MLKNLYIIKQYPAFNWKISSIKIAKCFKQVKGIFQK